MASPYEDILKGTSGYTSQVEESKITDDDEVGTFQSIMAGVGSGLF